MSNRHDDETSSGRERRSHPRVDARIEVRFQQTSDAAKAMRAFSVNFSAGGLCLKTQKSYPVGSSLRLSLTVGKQSFDLKGNVVWARGEVIGVRFEEVSAQDRDRLDALAEMLGQRRD